MDSIDPSIPLAGANIRLGPDPQQLMSLLEFGQRLRAQRQQQQNLNALRGVFSDPANLGPGGTLTPEAIARVSAVAPEMGMQLRNQASTLAVHQSEIDKNRAQMRDADVQRKQRVTGLVQENVVEPALVAYEDAIKRGYSPAQAAEVAQQAYTPLRESFSKSGMLGEGDTELPSKFNYDQFKAGALRYKDWRAQQDQPPKMRTRVEGEREVQEQWDPDKRQWVEIGGGPRFARQVAPVINLNGEASHFDGSKTGEDFLKTLPAADQALVRDISEGRIDPKTLSIRGGHRERILAEVAQYDAGYSQQDYGSQATALKAFTSGKSGQAVKSFNVALSHLDTLGQLANALDNGNFLIVNKIGNTVSRWSGSAAPTNFEAAKKIVADEVVKAIVGSGGGVQDREEAARTIDAAQSPSQLAGVIKTYKSLMGGQLEGLRKQYQESTGRKDFDRFLTDEAQTEVAQHAAPKGVPGAPARVRSDADYAQLPSGTVFVGPDGITRRKP